MAQIRLKQPGQPVADFAVAGDIITIASIVIDCGERQKDVAVNVEVRMNASGPGEGGNGAYLAQINIPARRYSEVDGMDAEGLQIIVREPVALDSNAVEITLWPTV